MASNPDTTVSQPIDTLDVDTSLAKVTFALPARMSITNMGAGGVVLRLPDGAIVSASSSAITPNSGEIALLTGQTIALDRALKNIWYRGDAVSQLRFVSGVQ